VEIFVQLKTDGGGLGRQKQRCRIPFGQPISVEAFKQAISGGNLTVLTPNSFFRLRLYKK